MIPLLAEITQHTPPAGFDNWIANAFYIVGLITAGVVLYKHLRKAPSQQMEITRQPLEVRGHVEYTPIAMHREFAKEIDAEIAELRQGLEKISSEGEERDIRIHDRIDKLSTEVGETPRKTVELLRATKNLL